jgi:hypothetical protein
VYDIYANQCVETYHVVKKLRLNFIMMKRRIAAGNTVADGKVKIRQLDDEDHTGGFARL